MQKLQTECPIMLYGTIKFTFNKVFSLRGERLSNLIYQPNLSSRGNDNFSNFEPIKVKNRTLLVKNCISPISGVHISS